MILYGLFDLVKNVNLLIKEELDLVVLTAHSLDRVKVFTELASIRFEIALIKTINILKKLIHKTSLAKLTACLNARSCIEKERCFAPFQLCC